MTMCLIPFYSQGRLSNPRVKIFLRVPDEKSGSGVKIQNYSHIQGKLARLNAAITEGLRNDQLKRENASQISTSTKPRIGAYTSPSTTKISSSTTTKSTSQPPTTTTTESTTTVVETTTGKKYNNKNK